MNKNSLIHNTFSLSPWMNVILGLKGNDLIVFSVVYSITRTGESTYYGGTRYIVDMFGLHKSSVLSSLKDLTEDEYLIKIEKYINGVPLPEYKANIKKINEIIDLYFLENKEDIPMESNENNNGLYHISLFDDGGSELRPPIEKNDGGGSKKLPYNINNNNKTNTAGRRERKSKKKNYKYNEDIDYDKLMAFYNEKFKGVFPSIMKITDKRKELISDRINETSKEAVFTVLMNVYNSDYLKKPNDRGWKCDFDWIFGEESFVKILEGKYNTNSIETIKPNTYD